MLMPWPWRRKTRKTLARIAIEGPISGGTRTRVLKAIKQVQDRECAALLLRIDSPGGTVGDSQEIHSALLRLKQKGCKVVASFGNISASGGVYLGVAADKIVANPGTITGSIGVILRGNNLSKLLERVGVSFETVKSGLFKDILSPDRALSSAERDLLQSLIDSSYGQFVEAVATGRALSEAAAEEGAAWTAAKKGWERRLAAVPRSEASFSRARARKARCCCPPESSRICRSCRSWSASASSARSTASVSALENARHHPVCG
jgi:protease-4